MSTSASDRASCSAINLPKVPYPPRMTTRGLVIRCRSDWKPRCARLLLCDPRAEAARALRLVQKLPQGGEELGRDTIAVPPAFHHEQPPRFVGRREHPFALRQRHHAV